MNVNDAIETRRSIRKYKRKILPKEVLDRLLEAARLAPSGMNRQFWELVVVTGQDMKDKLVPACGDQKFIGDCSAFIAAIDKPEEKWYRVDVTIALSQLSLEAVELGLGTCWIGRYDCQKVKEILAIPSDRVVTACMVVGYPDETPSQKPKKHLSQLVHYEKY
jgi:nitroreductase